MPDIDKLGNFQPDVLGRLNFAIRENMQDLEVAAGSGRLSTVAWLTRNLLELAIWTSYCARSRNNAKEFVLDAARDAHEAMNVPDGLFSKDSSFQAVRQRAIESAQ
jgi:hypothetical protein